MTQRQKEAYISLSDSSSSYSDETDKMLSKRNDIVFTNEKISLFHLRAMNIFSIIAVIGSYYVALISGHFANYNKILIFTFVALANVFFVFAFLRFIYIDARTEKDVKRIIKEHYSVNYFIANISLAISFIIPFFIKNNNNVYSLIFALVSLFNFSKIYYSYKSKEENLIITNNFDFCSLSYSITILLSFNLTYIVDIVNCLYQSELYSFALTLLSIVLISYYNDILFCFCVLIYQIGVVDSNWKALSGISTMFTAICFGYVAFGVISKKLPSKLTSKKDEKIIISNITDYNTTTIEDNGYESN